jgi:hypothetical protein
MYKKHKIKCPVTRSDLMAKENVLISKDDRDIGELLDYNLSKKVSARPVLPREKKQSTGQAETLISVYWI